MSILKCEMCGGTLEIEENGQYAVCAYCGTRKALPQNNTVNKPSIPALFPLKILWMPRRSRSYAGKNVPAAPTATENTAGF